MHIHILGICGTFMGGIAQLAKSLGIEVSGCDAGVYPPMSDQLEQAGIHLIEATILSSWIPVLTYMSSVMRLAEVILCLKKFLTAVCPTRPARSWDCQENILNGRHVLALPYPR